MKRQFAFCGWLACALGALQAAAAAEGQAQVVAVYTLPPIALGAIQNSVLPGTLAGDRQIHLGSIGSDLWRDASSRPAADGKLEFWMLTDRGPNGHVEVDGRKRRTFPTPAFNPLLIRAMAQAGSIDVLQVVPLAGRAGQPVTGLPNLPEDDAAYDFTGRERLAPDPHGVDPEGFVHTSQGDFWIVEEYRPSLLHVDRQGRMIARYIPRGERLEGVDYPVVPALPAVYRRRRANRGFEGLAISRDEKLLYLMLESPLANPDGKSSETSRNSRILVFDIAAEKCAAEFVYRLEQASQFDRHARQNDLRACAVALAAPDRLLVVERSDEVSKVFAIDLRQATNLLPTPWHAGDGPRTLETLENPPAEGIQLPAKSLVVDLSSLPQVPAKIEGLAIVDREHIAVSNDNDFDIGRFDEAGNNVGKGVASTIVVIRLPEPLY